VFCRYFLSWKVGKIERGGRGRHGGEGSVGIAKSALKP
jgi:hypothetical protein